MSIEPPQAKSKSRGVRSCSIYGEAIGRLEAEAVEVERSRLEVDLLPVQSSMSEEVHTTPASLPDTMLFTISLSQFGSTRVSLLRNATYSPVRLLGPVVVARREAQVTTCLHQAHRRKMFSHVWSESSLEALSTSISSSFSAG